MFLHSIPIFIACIVLFFIHRAHVKRVRREEKNDKDFDMDFGVGELPAPVQKNPDASLGPREPQDAYRSGSSVSFRERDLHPPPEALPYLVPKANVSHESLHSLSDPRDNPYGVIYSSSTPSSPGGVLSPFSDQASISGRSTRNLLASSQLDDQNPNKPPSRVPSPLAMSEISQPTKTLRPSKLLAETSERSSDTGPSKLRAPSPEQGLGFRHEDNGDKQPTPPSPRLTTDISARSQTTGESMKHRESDMSYRVPIAAENMAGTTNIEHMPIKGNLTETTNVPPDFVDALATKEESMTDFSPTAKEYQNPHDASNRHSHGMGEYEEDSAIRIQSVYNAYWNDSQYYDGSEEWESVPPLPQPQHQDRRLQPSYDSQYHPEPSMLSDYERESDYDRGSDYERGSDYDRRSDYNRQPSSTPAQIYRNMPQYWQEWQEDQYRRESYDHSHSTHEHVDLGVDTRWQPPQPPQPSFYSRPSTSYSMSSLPSRARTPSKPLEPLSDLPNTRYKLDDSASPISFAKPRRFAGAAGTASPVNRPASPAQVLSSSWSNLAELPVPHRLRRSGSFSSIDFAPSRKYVTAEADAGDTGSIRSFARTEVSLMAVSAGAGRVDRLPQDLVPMGKTGALASLRPQNYETVRYI